VIFGHKFLSQNVIGISAWAVHPVVVVGDLW